MSRKFIASVAAALALGIPMLFAPTQAQAERFERRDRPVRQELRRVVWQYAGGYFKDAGNGQWVENNASGTYNFRETQRTRDFVDLFDASRGLTARLYGNAMYLQGGDNFPVFTKFYDGNWTE